MCRFPVVLTLTPPSPHPPPLSQPLPDRNSYLGCHGDLPRIHRSERGARWRPLQLERVALQPVGGDPDGGAGGGSVHAPQGEKRPAPYPVRTGSVQPRHLPRSPQPAVVGIADAHLSTCPAAVSPKHVLSLCLARWTTEPSCGPATSATRGTRWVEQVRQVGERTTF